MPEFKWTDLDAFFVNLDSRPDRRDHMERELARVGIKASRQRGFLPDEVEGPMVDPSQVKVMRDRTPGTIGCHYSQREIIKRGAESGRNVLVMEDDVVWCDDLPRRVEILESFLAGREWDVIWLGGTIHINPPIWHRTDLGKDAERTDHPNVVRSFGAFCTFCYVVNGDSCEKIVRLLDENVHKSMGIDWLFIQIEPQLQNYMFLPGCSKQMDGISNIGVPRGNVPTITTFSHFARLGQYWFQPRMEDFDVDAFDWGEAEARKR